MRSALTKKQQERSTMPKRKVRRSFPSDSPNYIYILTPGETLFDKMTEMGYGVPEMASRMDVAVETVEKLIRHEIPLTRELAEKIEKATWLSADMMMRRESNWRKDYAEAMKHPEITAYMNGEIINQPTQSKPKGRPPMPKEDRRDQQVTVRLSLSELQQIEKKIGVMTLAEGIRELALIAKGFTEISSNDDRSEMIERASIADDVREIVLKVLHSHKIRKGK